MFNVLHFVLYLHHKVVVAFAKNLERRLLLFQDLSVDLWPLKAALYRL